MKVTLGALGIVLVLVDVVAGYRLWNSGWPKHVVIAADPDGGAHVRVMPIPFTGVDWCILVLVAAPHLPH